MGPNTARSERGAHTRVPIVKVNAGKSSCKMSGGRDTPRTIMVQTLNTNSWYTPTQCDFLTLRNHFVNLKSGI